MSPHRARYLGVFFAAAVAAVPLATTTVRCSEPTDPPHRRYLAVVGGTLIDGTGTPPVPDAVVIIEGDRVRAAGPRRQIRIPPGSIPLDATGLTVIPGLVDMHVHLIPGLDVGQFLEFGVTSVRHMGDTTLGWITSLKRRIDSGKISGPRVFHCGQFVVSQPPLNPDSYGPERMKHFAIMHSPSDAAAVVKRLVDAGAALVKVKTEMTHESLKALIEEANRAELPVSFDTGGGAPYYDALTALRDGARGVEHLSGIDFDDPNDVDAVFKEMLEAHAFETPTFTVLRRTESESHVEQRAAFTARFAAQGGMVVAGTDAPADGLRPGVSLLDELMELKAAGLSAAQALGAATGVAGRALGRQGLVGTLEAGSYADLVMIEGNPYEDIAATRRIVAVYKGGKQVFVAKPDGTGAAAASGAAAGRVATPHGS